MNSSPTVSDASQKRLPLARFCEASLTRSQPHEPRRLVGGLDLRQRRLRPGPPAGDRTGAPRTAGRVEGDPRRRGRHTIQDVFVADPPSSGRRHRPRPQRWDACSRPAVRREMPSWLGRHGCYPGLWHVPHRLRRDAPLGAARREADRRLHHLRRDPLGPRDGQRAALSGFNDTITPAPPSPPASRSSTCGVLCNHSDDFSPLSPIEPLGGGEHRQCHLPDARRARLRRRPHQARGCDAASGAADFPFETR